MSREGGGGGGGGLVPDTVDDIHIGINPWDGTCRGYAHATCSSEPAAARCVDR